MARHFEKKEFYVKVSFADITHSYGMVVEFIGPGEDDDIGMNIGYVLWNPMHDKWTLEISDRGAVIYRAGFNELNDAFGAGYEWVYEHLTETKRMIERAIEFAAGI